MAQTSDAQHEHSSARKPQCYITVPATSPERILTTCFNDTLVAEDFGATRLDKIFGSQQYGVQLSGDLQPGANILGANNLEANSLEINNLRPPVLSQDKDSFGSQQIGNQQSVRQHSPANEFG